MKIQIELKNSYRAEIEVDGKKCNYGYNRETGGWSFDDGITNEEFENTVGGIVLEKLTDNLLDILQGWMPGEQNPQGNCWGTWEQLTDTAADEIDNSIF